MGTHPDNDPTIKKYVWCDSKWTKNKLQYTQSVYTVILYICSGSRYWGDEWWYWHDSDILWYWYEIIKEIHLDCKSKHWKKDNKGYVERNDSQLTAQEIEQLKSAAHEFNKYIEHNFDNPRIDELAESNTNGNLKEALAQLKRLSNSYGPSPSHST